MTRHQYFPPIFTALVLAVFGILIHQHEHHLRHGQDIYIRLSPADPRSLIQGDYMRLGYDFYFTDHQESRLFDDGQPHHNQHPSHIKIWVLTDSRNAIIKSGFHQDEFSSEEQIKLRPLILNNPNNTVLGLYAASNSFLFAEGFSDCYAKAVFAHQKTDEEGRPILVDLVGEDFGSLHCEETLKRAHP